MTDATNGSARDRGKLLFWTGFAGLVLVAAWIDDRFLVDASDPAWEKFKQWDFLIAHAVAGVAALVLGPWQFSDRFRAAKPHLHRLMGRVYVAACLFAGPTAGVIAVQHHAPLTAAIHQVAEGALWALCTAVALVFAMRRQFAPHKPWMMRSYGFCLVFIFGRLPDIDPTFDWGGAPGQIVHLVSIATALLGPDLILAVRDALRRVR